MSRAIADALIERTFDAFSWRKLPEEVWTEEQYITADPGMEFDPLRSSEFGFEVFESEPWNGQGEAIRGMTVEGFLYYLPSFLSLLLQDRKRCNGLVEEVLCRLRSRAVYPGPFTMWIRHIRYQASFDGAFGECSDPQVKRPIDNLLDWFILKAESSQCDPIVQMTQQEREVVAQCLECFERTLKDEWLHGWRWTVNWIEAVRGVLLDAPLSRRLGARNDVDMADLIDLLEMAERCYPRIFSRILTQPIKRELRKEIATLPPPATQRIAASEAETSDIIARAFDAFSWRTLPATLWHENHYDAKPFEKEFRPVPPKEFDFDVYEDVPWLGQSDNIFVLTDEGILYYLPSLLSLILEDWDRSNELEISILIALRGFDVRRGPFGWTPQVQEPPSFLGSFVEYMDMDRDSESRRAIQCLLDWFVLQAESVQCDRVFHMTSQERRIVAQCLDYFEQVLRIESPAYWRKLANWIQAVRGILLDSPLSRRLGARSDEDVVDLIDLLDMSQRIYPRIFRPFLIDPIRRQLVSELA